MEHGFTAAVQRDALLPCLKDVKPQQFADVAQAVAGVKVQMDKEVLDGFWQETSDKLDKLTGGQCTTLRVLGSEPKPRTLSVEPSNPNPKP